MTKIPPDILQPTLWNLRQRTRGREARSALAVLASSPHDLATPLLMPTSALLAVSHSVGLVPGDTTIELSNGTSLSMPTLAADVVYKGIWAEQGQEVSVTGSPTGVLSPVIGTLRVAQDVKSASSLGLASERQPADQTADHGPEDPERGRRRTHCASLFAASLRSAATGWCLVPDLIVLAAPPEP